MLLVENYTELSDGTAYHSNIQYTGSLAIKIVQIRKSNIINTLL